MRNPLKLVGDNLTGTLIHSGSGKLNIWKKSTNEGRNYDEQIIPFGLPYIYRVYAWNITIQPSKPKTQTYCTHGNNNFLCHEMYWKIHKHLISWWRHQMETFYALRALCAGIHLSPVNSPHKGQWRGALMFSFICAWINSWVNNRKAGDLRRHRAHYDVTTTIITQDHSMGCSWFPVKISDITSQLWWMTSKNDVKPVAGVTSR